MNNSKTDLYKLENELDDLEMKKLKGEDVDYSKKAELETKIKEKNEEIKGKKRN